ncbi:hypothetical protein B0H11DRAFT_2186205 [Mycena galericulata]|nr:hypothetical protein B0H11DRAFT_2186205 [Mycena galericulata]
MSCSETGKRVRETSDNVAHPIWTEIGAQETGAGSGGIGREARAVEIPGGSGTRRQARESAEKEGIFVPAVRVPGQRREAPEWVKAGEQWNQGHRGCKMRIGMRGIDMHQPFYVKGAVPVQQRRAGSGRREATAGWQLQAAGPGGRQRQDIECFITNRKRATRRRAFDGRTRKGAPLASSVSLEDTPDYDGLTLFDGQLGDVPTVTVVSFGKKAKTNVGGNWQEGGSPLNS